MDSPGPRMMGVDPTPVVMRPTSTENPDAVMLAAAEHTQLDTNSYHVHYPEHGSRADDPYYHLFDAVRRQYRTTAVCWYGHKIGTVTRCCGPLELHHWVLEQAMINEVDLRLIGLDFPDAGANTDEIDHWVESHYAEDGSGALVFMCVLHHRGEAGVHTVDYANWKASWYAPSMLPGPPGT